MSATNEPIVAALQTLRTLKKDWAKMDAALQAAPTTATWVQRALNALSESGFNGVHVVYINSPFNVIEAFVPSQADENRLRALREDMPGRTRCYLTIMSKKVVVDGASTTGNAGRPITPMKWHEFDYESAIAAFTPAIHAQTMDKVTGILLDMRATFDKALHEQPYTLAIVGTFGPNDFHYWSVDTVTKAHAEILRDQIKHRLGPLEAVIIQPDFAPGEERSIFVDVDRFQKSVNCKRLVGLFGEIQVAVDAVQGTTE